MRTSCCLNLLPPSSNQALNASLIPIKPPQVSLVNSEGCWRRQCVVMGVASYCTIFGLEMGNSMSNGGQGQGAVAQEMMMLPVGVESNNSSLWEGNRDQAKVGVVGATAKWSEKRACPSWLHNSLETIVPENLPRPAARRRYEAVRSSSSKDAPPVSGEVKLRSNPGCFSM